MLFFQLRADVVPKTAGMLACTVYIRLNIDILGAFYICLDGIGYVDNQLHHNNFTAFVF